MSSEKSELCELVTKFLAHQTRETNRYAEQLVEEMKKQERLSNDIGRIRAGGYPDDLTSTVARLLTIMNVLQIDHIHLFGLKITK